MVKDYLRVILIIILYSDLLVLNVDRLPFPVTLLGAYMAATSTALVITLKEILVSRYTLLTTG